MRIRKVWMSLVVVLCMVEAIRAGEIGYSYYEDPAWTNVGAGGTGIRKMAAGTNGMLYVGGVFTEMGGVTAANVAAWNGSSWTNVGFGMPYGENNRWGLFAIATGPNGMMYAGGPFTNGGNVGANYLAQWNGTNWARVGTGPTDLVTALATATNGDLYASGWFSSIGGVSANYIAKWNGSSWSAMGSGLPSYDKAAKALAAGSNGILYAAGAFTTIGGVSANRVAKWNGTSWSSMGSGLGGAGVDYVEALAVAPNGDVYAGGWFTNSGGVAIQSVAKWNGSSWSGLGNGLYGIVYALAVATNGDVYAGGTFTNSGGAGVSRIAKWNGASWESVGLGMGAGANGEVSSLAMPPNQEIYAAGSFSTAGGVAATGIAQWARAYYETDGVEPNSGSWEGGYPVTIVGPGLGNGSDITDVKLCGVSVAEISSQTSSQVVVVAGRSYAVGTGDVKVYSANHGMAVASNLFSYTGPGLQVLGTNSEVIENDGAPGKAQGTAFGHLLAGNSATQTFSLSNQGGTEVTTISGFDVSDPAFTVTGLPEKIGVGGVSNFTVRFSPPTLGNYAASLILSNDACSGIYTVKLAGAAYTLSTNIGPNAGGNALTITNGHLGTITNVLVNGVVATIQDAGDNWVRVEIPNGGGVTGVVDAVVQTSDNGDILMPQVYEYNLPGVIRGEYGVFSPLTMLTNTWLDGTNGFAMVGTRNNDYSGYSIRPAGDVNGDGWADVIMGAPFATRLGTNAVGETYLVYGSTNGFPASYADLTNSWLDGTNGIILTGFEQQDYSGYAVDGAGDVNGDGYDDILIGAYRAYGFWSQTGIAGKTYLVYGGSHMPAQIHLNPSWFNGTNGTVFAGAANDIYSGETLAGVGDVNGDGYADFIIGAKYGRGTHSYYVGHTYLVYGSPHPYPANITLNSDWLNGTNGMTFEGLTNTLTIGKSVSAAGDVNGDGYDDFLTGSDGAQPDGYGNQGAAFLVFGQSAKFAPLVTLSPTWATGTNGVWFTGATNQSNLAGLMAAAGDVNADGFDDILLSQTFADTNHASLVYGRGDFPATVNLGRNWFDGANGSLFAGNFLASLSGAGDVNHDGADDLLLGMTLPSPMGITNAGAAYLVYGSRSGLPALQTLSLASMNGTNGCAFGGDQLSIGNGIHVSGAGDFNGDGADDALVSFSTASANGILNVGKTALIFGRYPILAVDPFAAHMSGGTAVAIHGAFLGNGSDITGVTLCGIPAAIVGQSTTSVWVTAGASPTAGVGDVVVDSVSFGTTVASNAFTYTVSEISWLGTNGSAVAENEAASAAKGGVFAPLKAGLTASHVFTITNSGLAPLNISGWSLTGEQGDLWSQSGMPSTLAAGATASVTLTYAPTVAGHHVAQVAITNDSLISPWRINVEGSAWALTSMAGPAAGGNTLTITNGHLGVVTNVRVDGVSVAIVDSGASWVTIEMPANSTPGLKDILVQTETGDISMPGAYTYNPAGVIEGYLPPWNSTTVLTNTTYDGTNGLIFAGSEESLLAGVSVASAGDVNGDGFDDALIGFRQSLVSGAYRSGVFLVYGRREGMPPLSMLTNTWLDGVNGSAILHTNIEYNGASCAAGDVNGDGYGDLLVSAPQGSPEGHVYVIFGGTNLPATLTLSNGWANGANGVVVQGEMPDDLLGLGLGGVGDVNGDGIPDVAIGSMNSDPMGVTNAGKVFLVYGRTNGWSSTIKLDSEFVNGTNAVALAGAVTGGNLGYHINQAGDVNQDGLNDLLLGFGVSLPPGETFLVYGRTNLPASMVLSNGWFNGTNGTRFTGTAGDFRMGRSATFCGDMDGDGRTDLLLANELGASLVYGRSSYPAQVTVTNTWLEAGNGVSLMGTAGQYIPITGIGDINNDGLADIGFGGEQGQISDGHLLVVFGRTNWPGTQLMLTDTWLNGTNGVRFSLGGSYVVGNLAGAGDFNGDGVDDLLLGKNADSIYGFNGGGAAYLHFGVPAVLAVDPPVGVGAGGYPVTINGRDLGNGEDIYQVTLCGSTASIVSQSATQVVVTAGAGAGRGDVRVHSTSFGETVKSNGFEYSAPLLQFLGTNGVALASGEEASIAAGTDFGHVGAGETLERVFRVRNAGPIALSISSWTTNGTGSAQWSITGVPATLAPGATSVVTVLFSPAAAGSFECGFRVASDSPVTPYVFNVAGAGYQMSSREGPMAGGNFITVSNGHFGSITNVRIGGVDVLPTASGGNWFTVQIPGAGAPGVQDIVVQTTTGDVTIAGAYTYNVPGVIGSVTVDSSRWMEVTNLPQRLTSHAGAEYNGALYSIGGNDGSTYYKTNVFRFDGANWTQVAGLPAGRRDMAAAALNGKLYAMGGSSSVGFSTNVYAYDGTNWTEMEGMPQARIYFGAATFDGAIYSVAGMDSVGNGTTNVFRFDGTNWTEVEGLPGGGRRMQGGVATFDGALYSVGGMNYASTITNVYRFDGTSWTEVKGLTVPKRGMGVGLYAGELYVFGGYDGNSEVATSYRYNGSRWTNAAALPQIRYGVQGGALNGKLIAFGGSAYSTSYTNTYAYPATVVDFGVSPVSGSWTGGFPVVISGSNLCSGSDVTVVTICGNSASVQSQSATQIVVLAGAGLNPGLGDVRVFSTGYGETVKSNAFTYLVTGPGLRVLGTNGAVVATDAAASAANGTRFPRTVGGQAVTNWFAITNNGTAMMSITGFGMSSPDFRVDTNLFTALNPGSTQRFYIAFAPLAGGDFSGALVITNNSVASNYVINLAGSCVGIGPSSGPWTGGNEVTITNGDLSAVTNVIVGGIPVTVRTNNAHSITITIPTNSLPGPQTVVIQFGDGEDIILNNAYTVNSPGAIGEYRVLPGSWTNLSSGFNGLGRAVVRNGSNVYVGGNFTTAGGSPANYIAVWNGTSWTNLGSGMNGGVLALAHDGTNLYAGGQFTTAGGLPANYIAKWNGTTWTNLGSGMNFFVDCLLWKDGQLYAGGDFSTAGGVSASRLAQWNGTAWTNLGSGLSGRVFALTRNGSDLYAAGQFTTAGGVSASRIARWNGTSWTNLGTGVDNDVLALSHDGTNLYAGGQFYTAGGSTANYVAQWNGASWTNLGSGAGNTVRALEWSAGTLYAGGDFWTNGGGPGNYVAKWNGTSWTNLGTGLNGSTYALDHEGSNLWVMGSFTMAGGNSAVRAARWTTPIVDRPGVEPASGSWDGGYPVTIYGSNLADPADTPIVTLCGVTATVTAVQGSTQLVVNAGTTDVAGSGDVRVESQTYGVTIQSNGFTYVPAGPYLTVLGTNGAAVASGSGASADKGTTFPRLILGASVTNRLAITNQGSASVTISGYQLADNSFHVIGLPSVVAPGTVSNFNIVFTPAMGGDFSTALVISNNSPTAAYTVNLEGSCLALSATKGPSVGGNEITITNGNLTGVTNITVGGIPVTVRTNNDHSLTILIPTNSTPGTKDVVIQFADGGGMVLSNAYVVNVAPQIGTPYAPRQWTGVGSGMQGSMVQSIAKSGNDLFVGGNFTNAGGQTAQNIARWDGTNWYPLGAGLSGSASGLVPDGGDLYAGGQFYTSGSVTSRYVAKWDGNTWSKLGSGVNSTVSCLAGNGSNLYAAGWFTEVDGQGITNIAKWNGSSWSALGEGLNQSPNGMEYRNGQLYVFGNFTNSGSMALRGLARWTGTTWENLNEDSTFMVQNITHDGVNLYAAGPVMSGSPPFLTHIKKWDGSAWASIASGSFMIGSMTSDGTNLFVAGMNLTVIDGVPVQGIAKWDGAQWSAVGTAPMSGVIKMISDGAILYAGGMFTNAGTVETRYIAQYIPERPGTTGVSPASGATAGGYELTITGANLGDGADITNVMVCGASAAIVSQSSTQVVVTVGAALVAGLGDVRVFSTSFGESVSSNAFTYSGTVELQLTVVSAHGVATPAVGVHAFEPGTMLTNSVTSPDTVGGTQYVCTGWALAGNEPATGTNVDVVLTLTNHATLTWLWTTNYHLDPEAGPGGSINQAADWFAKGDVVSITATASDHYHFTNWTGSVTSLANPLELTMDAAYSVTANFDPDRTSGGVPIPWLAEYGFTNDFEEVADEDTDHDGVPNNLEFIADTNPTNPASYFAVAGFETAYGTNYVENVTTNSEPPYDVVTQRVYEVVGSVMRFTASTGRVYEVQSQIHVWATNWPPVPGRTNLTTTSGTLVITNLFDSDPRKFYRLGVRLP